MRRVLCLLVLGALLVMLPACGGGGKSAPPCPPKADTRAAVNGAVTVCGSDPFRFDVKTITATAGPLTVTFINKGQIAHTFKIKDTNFELKANGHNDVKTGTVTLAKGSYEFVCTVSGHEAGGMKGTLDVA